MLRHPSSSSFFAKKELDLSAAFLAGLGLWAGLPWALKMPVGHLVDLYWRKKSWFVYLGAFLMRASLLIMIGLTGNAAGMAALLPVSTWYILSILLAPIGYMLQDVVADAMTVEAVPAFREDGSPVDRESFQRMHVTMQTMGRIAIVRGARSWQGSGGGWPRCSPPIPLDPGRPVRGLFLLCTGKMILCSVISTHGRTGWKRFVFGSVAEKVVRTASCPVLTIPDPDGRAAPSG